MIKLSTSMLALLCMLSLAGGAASSAAAPADADIAAFLRETAADIQGTADTAAAPAPAPACGDAANAGSEIYKLSGGELSSCSEARAQDYCETEPTLAEELCASTCGLCTTGSETAAPNDFPPKWMGDGCPNDFP